MQPEKRVVNSVYTYSVPCTGIFLILTLFCRIELNMELPASGTATVGASAQAQEQDELSQRLQKLRNV